MSSFVEHAGKWRRQWIRQASSSLTFHAINLFGFLIRLLNRHQARRVAFFLGDFMHRVVGLRRSLVYRNLGLTFPEKSPSEIRRIATGVYRNVAGTFLEVLRFPLIKSLEDVASLVQFEEGELLQSIRKSQTGAVFVSAHYGNWELMAMAAGLLVHPVTIVVKRLRNAAVDRRMNELRTMWGNSIVYDDRALREGLRVLADGGLLAILGDQSDPNSGNYGEFLGRRATMFHGPAFFALKAKVPLIIGICRSKADGSYMVDLQEVDTSDLTFSKEDITTLTSRYTRVLEEYIIRWPEDWFWLHDRWKRQ
jgi:KDO2-lipid IV(A) lauroyltransferase